MNAAIIDTYGFVENIIWVSPNGPMPFKNVYPIGNLRIFRGDMYLNGNFYRGGSVIKE